MPAAVADWMPRSASSKTRQSAGGMPSFSAAMRKGSGAGLPWGTRGADEDFEEREDAEGGESADDGVARTAGDDGEGDVAVGFVDDGEDVGDGLELREQFEVEVFFFAGDLLDVMARPWSW